MLELQVITQLERRVTAPYFGEPLRVVATRQELAMTRFVETRWRPSVGHPDGSVTPAIPEM
jgi:hypothetical protein